MCPPGPSSAYQNPACQSQRPQELTRDDSAMTETDPNAQYMWYPREQVSEVDWSLPATANHNYSTGIASQYLSHPFSSQDQHQHHQPQPRLVAPVTWEPQTSVLASAYYPPSAAFDNPSIGSSSTSSHASTNSDWSAGSPLQSLSVARPQASSHVVAPSPVYPIPGLSNLEHRARAGSSSSQAQSLPFASSSSFQGTPYPRHQGHLVSNDSSFSFPFPYPTTGAVQQPAPLSTAPPIRMTDSIRQYVQHPSAGSAATLPTAQTLPQIPAANPQRTPNRRASPIAPYPSPSTSASSRQRTGKGPAGESSPATSVEPEVPVDTAEKSVVEVARPLPSSRGVTADHTAWRLTSDIYLWLEATLDPKRRPDKSKPAPSGQCKLCPSVCKRSGTLQQHISILHRQKLSRKVIAGQRYNLELGLAFVIAQMRSDREPDPPADEERTQFLEQLAAAPEGLTPLMPDAFPLLRQKLQQFCNEERWVGAKCELCGTMVARRMALEEHMPVCVANPNRRTVQQTSKGIYRPSQYTSTDSSSSSSSHHLQYNF